MPHITIQFYPGRSEEVKKDLAEKMQNFYVETMNTEAKYCSVSIEEIEKDNWNEEVVKKIKEDELYIKPKF